MTENAEAVSFVPQLIWLRAADGEIVATCELPQLQASEPHLGPLWTAGGSLWLLYGSGPNDPRRELIHLTPRDDQD
jgi:hypothetical protein